MSLLTADEVQAFITSHGNWLWADREISRTYVFDDFAGSMDFVNRVAAEAEKADHHPDIDIRWNQVTLTLSTHSEGGLTPQDLELAEKFDGLT